jgi:hypothetical protein
MHCCWVRCHHPNGRCPPSPTVLQYSCSTTNPSVPRPILPSPSSLVPPTGAAMACSSINWKTCIDEALSILEEPKVMVEEMKATKEVKSATLLVVLPPSPQFDGTHSSSLFSMLPLQVIVKRRWLRRTSTRGDIGLLAYRGGVRRLDVDLKCFVRVWGNRDQLGQLGLQDAPQPGGAVMGTHHVRAQPPHRAPIFCVIVQLPRHVQL